MRLSSRNLRTVYLRKRKVKRDNEGNEVVSFSEDYVELVMIVQPAGGKVMASIYGEDLKYVKSCKYQGELLKPGQNEKDGMCLHVDKTSKPDYIITSIIPYSYHFNVTLEASIRNESKNKGS